MFGKEKRVLMKMVPVLLLLALVVVVGHGRVLAAPADDLIITGVIDGPLSGGVPKAVELYVVNDIPDLSVYGLGSANNGGGTDGQEFTFPADSATAGQFIYVASEDTGFNTFFGFDPDYTSGAMGINGDDAIELFTSGTVSDVFGDINTDGTGEAWDHLDGWAYRNDETGPDGSTFVVGNWSFSGTNALDNETSNATATTPFPIGTYSPGAATDTPPQVSSTSPADSATDVLVGSTITLNFNEVVDLATGAVTVECPVSTAVTFTPALPQNDVNSITLTPDSALPEDTVCTVTAVATAITDNDDTADQLDGNGDGTGGDDYTFTFTTAPPPTIVKIHEVQGTGDTVANDGATVTVEAIVVGDFQDSEQLSGFFIQEEDADADTDPASSEGIFVYCGSCTTDVAVGDKVQVTGVQDDFFDMSQLGATSGGSVVVVSSGNTLPTAATVALPIPNTATSEAEAEDAVNDYFEPFEGMLVEFTNTLTVAEYFQLGRYGQIVLSNGRIEQFTNANAPSAAGYTQHQIDKIASTIILDDDNNRQNDSLDFTDPSFDTAVFHPVPGFTAANYVRGGDTIASLTGVLHWSFAGQSGTDAWRIRPVTEEFSYDFTEANPRPAVPDVGGNIKVASFNVLNYFNGDGSGGGFPTARGAHSAAELTRQTDKIVAAINSLDADVIGLMEIENDFADGGNSAIADLVDALNAVAGAGTYAYIDPGSNVGTDEIAVAIIYKPASVSPVGNVAIADASAFTDPNGYGSAKNRPAVAATFEDTTWGERFTVVVNHLKSKGSECGAGDDDTTTGQGNCNDTRKKAAEYMVNTWLPSDPTMSGDPDFLIIGDLNAYAMEDPITAIKNASYTDLIDSFSGGDAYGYVFNGEVGYLDHGLSSATLTPQVTGAMHWHINADEVGLLDYNDDVEDSGESSYERKSTATDTYEPDAYRSSDHDPVLIGLDLQPDLSDLDSYGQAWHTGNGELKLGSSWTSEASNTTDGDDSDDGVEVIDGANGSTLGNSVGWDNGTDGGGLKITITGGNGCVDAWIDWDGDNSFTQTGDYVLQAQEVTAGANNLLFDVPAGTFPGGAGANETFNYRVRLTPREADDSCSSTDSSFYEPITMPVAAMGLQALAGAPSATDRALGGEVEDGVVAFTPTAVSLNTFSAMGGQVFTAVALLMVGLLLFVSLFIWRARQR